MAKLSVHIFLTMQHLPKVRMWARSSMGYGLSAKQVTIGQKLIIIEQRQSHFR